MCSRRSWRRGVAASRRGAPGPNRPVRGIAACRRPRRNRRRPNWARLSLSAVLFATGAAGIWQAFNSPYLVIRRIVVTGSESLSPEQVAAMTGLRIGTNIFRANLYRAGKAVRSVPAIREASVARLLPGTIVITVVERRPVLTVAQGRRRFEVDAEGVVFQELPASAPLPADRLLLSLRPGPSLRLGERLDGSLIQVALHCARLARAEGLSLWKLSIDAHDDLWLNVKVAGQSSQPAVSLPIRIGRPQELSAKFADTRHVLQHAPHLAAVAQYLDVSCPRRPAYRVAAEDSGSAVAPMQ